jgi:nitrogen regulatory protein PII
MKEVKAFIRADRADEVLTALSGAGLLHATLTHVLAMGPNTDPTASQVSMEFGRRVNRMVKLEVICPDRDIDRVVEIVRTAACTGQSGDGIISVCNVNRLVKVRNAEESTDAL